MTEPMDDAELEQIRADYAGVDEYDAVPRLLAEVDRLRTELAEVTSGRDYLSTSLERQIDAHEHTTQKWENADAEVERLRAECDGWKENAVETLRMYERLRAERDTFRDLAEELYKPEPCWFDHHGGCQEHLWLDLGPGEECPDGRAQRLFAKGDDDDRTDE